MNSNTKIVLRKKPNAQGQYPLAIRITKNRRSTFKFIGHYIDLEDWDSVNQKVKKSHPNAALLNNLISSKLSEVTHCLITLQTQNKDCSARQIKHEVYRPSVRLDFFDYAKDHLELLEAEGKLNRLSVDSAWIKFISKYTNSKSLSFQEIDTRFLNKMKATLKNKNNLSETSVMNIMVLVRLLFNRAIKDRIIDKDFYPFGKGKFKIKFPPTTKIGLTKDEINILEGLENLSPSERHALNVWLFSFYFAGMRISDILFTGWSHIHDGRLYYRMRKNSKLLSLKIPKKAKAILDIYLKQKENNNGFVFPELSEVNLKDPKDVYNKVKTSTKKFNDALGKISIKAGIKKKITMHIARHSFGNVAGENIHPLMLQKLYRHSDLKTTINYQSNFIHRDADEALLKVLDF